MENTFDLKKFLVENKLTNNSRILSESSVEGIDLNLVKALQNEPAMQTLQTQLKNNPELAKKAAKLVAGIVDGTVSESINELHRAPQDYRFSPEEIQFAKEKGVVRSKYSSDQAYADMIFWVNDTYNPAMTTGIYEKPKPQKEDPNWLKKFKNTLGFFGMGSLVGVGISLARIASEGGGPYSGIVADIPPIQLLATILISGLVVAGLGHGADIDENVGDLAGEVQAIIDAGREL